MNDLADIHGALRKISEDLGRIDGKVERNYSFTKGVSESLETLSTDASATKEKLAKYENRGVGIASGLAVAAGTIGAGFSHILDLFKGN